MESVEYPTGDDLRTSLACIRRKATPVKNIQIKRYENDSQLLGYVEPDDKRWQLVIDKEGYPHLWIRVKAASEEETGTGNPLHGYLSIEDLLPKELTIPDLMEGVFGEPVTEEQAAEFMETFEPKSPCPRY
jgi:hypothetical protein